MGQKVIQRGTRGSDPYADN